jgi:hypothetical protein
MDHVLPDYANGRNVTLDRKLETGSAARDLRSGYGEGRASESTPSKREESSVTGRLPMAGGAVKRNSAGTGASEGQDRTDRHVGPGYPSIGWGRGGPKRAVPRTIRPRGRPRGPQSGPPRAHGPLRAEGRQRVSPRVSAGPLEARTASPDPRFTPGPRWCPCPVRSQSPSLGPRVRIQSP